MSHDRGMSELPEGERVLVHVLGELLPRILAPVAEAALSPLMSRVDRALGILEGVLALGNTIVALARESRDDLVLVRKVVEKVGVHQGWIDG